MILQAAASEAVEYAALPAPAAAVEELLLRGVLLGALLVFAVLLARVALRRWGVRSPRPQSLELSFVRDWLATQGTTIDRASAERMSDWLEQSEPRSCAASAAPRTQLTALLQIPRYGGPAADTAPIRAVIEDWLQSTEPTEQEA